MDKSFPILESDLLTLHEWDREKVIKYFEKNDPERVSIRAEEFDGAIHLIGIYSFTEEEYIQYKQNGGVWTYYTPYEWANLPEYYE